MSYIKENCKLLATDRNIEPPGPGDLQRLRKEFGLTQIDVAKIVGVRWTDKGSSTVAKWEVPRNKFDNRQMPYSAWRLLLITLKIVEVVYYEREK